MSLLTLPVYKDEADVHSNPAVDTADQNTHATSGGKLIPKKVAEILIKWVVDTWVVQSVWSAGTIVALEATNPVTTETAWYDYPMNDFIAAQCCASPDPIG